MEKLKGKVYYSYDTENDVLYSYINKPRSAYCIEKDNGVLIRTDPKTNKVVGFTVIDYKRRILNNNLTEIPYFGKVKDIIYE